MLKSVIVASCIAAVCQAHASDEVIAKLEISLTFGGAVPSEYAAQFGASYSIDSSSESEVVASTLPVTGLSFGLDRGIAPTVFGSRITPHSLGASEGEGISWGWWAAAGIGVAIAVAAAGGSDEKTTTDGSSGNETECGIGDNGGLLPVIDLNCFP